jgi:hypothetical protein
MSISITTHPQRTGPFDFGEPVRFFTFNTGGQTEKYTKGQA